MECFDTLPISCLINGKFLAVHGGLSPELETIADLNILNRFSEPPRSGLYCDLLWSDPVDSETGDALEPYTHNDVRGCSYYYNVVAVRDFLHKNNLLSIIRAHEAQIDGYKLHKWEGGLEFPVVITVFSAPNYCDVYHNKGAIIKFENDTLTIE
jgi:serine/threonine-protein phosphatase 2B catalytic subunit